MNPNQHDFPRSQKPLRLWPGVVAAVLLCLVTFGIPIFAPDQSGTAIMAGIICGLLVIVWWLFFSRAPWPDRIGAIVVMVISVIVTKLVVHKSIANGMMGMMLPIFSVPIMSLALVIAVAMGNRLSVNARRVAMSFAILLGCGLFTLIRTGGMTGDANSDLHWRWTKTPEELLLAQARDVPPQVPPVAATPEPEEPVPAKPGEEPTPTPAVSETPQTRADWPGFRGAARDSIVRAVRIETDWAKSPPVEVWRRKVGPGWSSFAVQGDLVYTQEQRGEDEDVSCYSLTTGEPVWRHRDKARFWESNAGAGPRGTPTLSKGRVYTFGATGILNALDARNGAVVWSRNAALDTGAKLPNWGFASSPLVVGDKVIIATAGILAAYDRATGKPRWQGPTGGNGYSSPQLSTIDGVAQILLVNGDGLISLSPADGTLLWKHDWAGDGIVQPALIGGGNILIGSGSGLAASGMRRVAAAHGSDGWTVEERWTTNGLKPYYNDFVVHKGNAYGFDGSILACIGLEDGKRKWKGGRYGHGQLILLPEQDLLLVLSEEGELALVKATGDQFTELAKFKAIEGKTWNHPVLVGDQLLVRNGEEMAAFRLFMTSR
ncbi:MAG: PQQ-binding-like beta-propeller repeat protein [Acidobacteria bacterium]|nr:PQQ-binding-like beta-propeller repeat protein [Acidobacteriota bacterium]